MGARAPKGLFVVGTDTGVGKTLVSAALARFLVETGQGVRVMKPVETGVADPSGLGPDGEILRWAAGSPEPAGMISPYRFSLPLAPSLAAEAEGIRIDPQALIEEIRKDPEDDRVSIIEGAGGLMVPLAGGFTIADLALQSGLPVLIVARPGLGTINHTLLTVFAARTMQIDVAGIMINGMPSNPDSAEESAPHALASLASATLLGVLPRVAGPPREKVLALAEEFKKLPTLPWLRSALGLSPTIHPEYHRGPG